MGWKVIDSLGQLKQSVLSSGSINSFETIAVSGQSNVVADSSTDTLTIVAGSNVTITTTAGTDTVTIAADDNFVLGTEQASTSGTAIDFTGIPSGTKVILIHFIGVSTNGTSLIIIQLGDAGGFETSGYTGCTVATGAAAAGVNWGGTGMEASRQAAASQILHGTLKLSLEDSTDFTWIGTGLLARSTEAINEFMAGSKSLTAELTQIRITTINGTDAFDAGSINISYIGT